MRQFTPEFINDNGDKLEVKFEFFDNSSDADPANLTYETKNMLTENLNDAVNHNRAIEQIASIIERDYKLTTQVKFKIHHEDGKTSELADPTNTGIPGSGWELQSKGWWTQGRPDIKVRGTLSLLRELCQDYPDDICE